MIESNLVNGWVSLLCILATIALIVMAVAVVLRIVKPADILKHIGALVIIVLLLTILPGVLIHAWSALEIWQQIGLLAIGIGICLWRNSPRQSRRKRRERTD